MKILVGSPSKDSWGGPAACEPPFVDALRASGHHVTEVVYVHGDKAERTSIGERVRRVLESAKGLRRALEAENFNIVHLNTSFDLKTILRDAYCISRMPLGAHRIFLKMHGSDARGQMNAGPILQRLISYIKRRADAIGVLSTEERDDFVALGFEADKIFRVLNVVELEEAPAEPQSRREEKTRLIFVSRLIATKGLSETIRAVKILKDDGVAISLTVAGDGDARADAEALVFDLGLSDEVEFTGYVPEAEVAELMSSSDIFVFPTRHIEGLPIALYKAAIAGLPIVTTPVRSATDLMTDGENCLFCTSDPADIAAKTRLLIESPELRARMTENNRKFCDLLSRQKVASEYLAMYSEIVAK